MLRFITGNLSQIYYKIKYRIKRDKFGYTYKHLGIPYFSEKQMADKIRECLKLKIPYCVGKIGGNEANAIAFNNLGSVSQKKLAYDRLCHFAGFFPRGYSEVLLKRYTDIQTNAISDMDMLIYYEKDFEEYLLRKYASPTLVWSCVVGSWSQDIPWTKELKGYRVVIVHPYAELIERQYKRREEIYRDSDVLPEFELRVVKAVQTMAGASENRFNSWFDALDYMYSEIMKEDFDIALIGCGAYGLPLAAKVKEAGKIGVHMGGDLQMLFGIRGKRWDDREKAQKWFNDSWVRPSEEYKVSGYDSIEGGCYW